MTTSNRTPLLAIGMPLHNEEEYLRQSLDSLLAQDFKEFEIVIFDNGSTDDTQKICREYAEKDSRVLYHRNETILDQVTSFNRPFEIAGGKYKYFMWAAGHDLWEQSMIEKCIAVLEKDSQVVLALPVSNIIDRFGVDIKVRRENIDTRGSSRFSRYIKMIWVLYDEVVYAVIRTDALTKAGPYRHVIGPDHILRVELSLLGTFAHIQEPLFLLRSQRGESPRGALQRRKMDLLLRESGFIYYYFPHFGMIYEFARAPIRQLRSFWKSFVFACAGVFVGVLRFARVLPLDIIYFLSIPFKFRQ